MAGTLSHADWRSRAARLEYRTQAFVNGRYVDTLSGHTFDCINPANGNLLTKIAAGDGRDVDRAVAAARAAFNKGHWSRMPARQRKKILQRFAALIERHGKELALLETLDMGMPIRDSSTIDIPMSVECIQWYAESIDKLYDEVAPTGPQAVTLIRREPVGVIAAVVPWNYPLLMAAWKIGPVLATGNSIVLKPAEQSPLTALRIAELTAEAGIPDGVFNVVPGFGESAGQALGRHMDVDGVTFTGSVEVGKLFLRYAGESNMKRVSLECGGKTPNIVMADAHDLDAAATAAAWGIFFNQGEVCNAGSRLIVQESVKDRVLEKVIAVGRTMQPGDPLDPETVMGAIVDETQMQRVLRYIDIGRAEGARLCMGGSRVREEAGGYYIEPTVFDRVGPTMRIAQEEIFGPVLSAITFKEEAEAFRIANDTIYGLGAAVWTRDVTTAHRAAQELRVGVVWINCFDYGDISSPVGGFKQSGFGRDKSLHAMEKYTELKAVWINLGQ